MDSTGTYPPTNLPVPSFPVLPILLYHRIKVSSCNSAAFSMHTQAGSVGTRGIDSGGRQLAAAAVPPAGKQPSQQGMVLDLPEPCRHFCYIHTNSKRRGGEEETKHRCFPPHHAPGDGGGGGSAMAARAGSRPRSVEAQPCRRCFPILDQGTMTLRYRAVPRKSLGCTSDAGKKGAALACELPRRRRCNSARPRRHGYENVLESSIERLKPELREAALWQGDRNPTKALLTTLSGATVRVSAGSGCGTGWLPPPMWTQAGSLPTTCGGWLVPWGAACSLGGWVAFRGRLQWRPRRPSVAFLGPTCSPTPCPQQADPKPNIPPPTTTTPAPVQPATKTSSALPLAQGHLCSASPLLHFAALADSCLPALGSQPLSAGPFTTKCKLET